MSINDAADDIGDIARQAAFEAGALKGCELHTDAVVYRGDPEADRRAYAYATVRAKAAGYGDWLKEVAAAVDQEFVEAAEECPYCNASERD